MFDYHYYASMVAGQSWRTIGGYGMAYRTVAERESEDAAFINTDERYGDNYEVTLADYETDGGEDYTTWFEVYDDTIRQYWQQIVEETEAN